MTTNRQRDEDLVMNDYGNEEEIYKIYKDREELKKHGFSKTPDNKKNINPFSCILACFPNNIQIGNDKSNNNHSNNKERKEVFDENNENNKDKNTVEHNGHEEHKSDNNHHEKISALEHEERGEKEEVSNQ